MRFRVRIADSADADMGAIYDYIAVDSPSAAEAWLLRVSREIDGLARLPRRCRVAPESEEAGREVRQLVIGSYRVLFVIDDDEVVVVHVRHAARRPGMGP